MKRTTYWGRISLMSLVVFLVCYAEAAAFPRSVDWRQIKTEHFTIVFLEQHRDVADYVAALAESIQELGARILDYPARKRIYVVVTDHIDQADLLIVEPLRSTMKNRIVLLLSNKASSISVMSVPAKQWVRTQFIYQYVRVLWHQMDRKSRQILSFFVPSEGFAGWLEGGVSLYGFLNLRDRLGRFPFLDMFMRAEVLANDLKVLQQQAAFGSKEWPGDLGAVLYGYSFLLYLSDTYGEDLFSALNRFQKRNASTPFRTPFKKMYEKSLETLQVEWLAALKGEYQKQIAQIRQQPVTPMRPLSDMGYFTGTPVFAPDGESVYYIEDSPHRDRSIVRVQLSDQKKVRLTTGDFSGNLSISPDGQSLYFGKTNRYKIYYQYSDLYRLDLATRKVTRLTWGERAFDPAIAPHGQSLVYITTEARTMTVKRLDLTTGEQTVIFEPEEFGTQIRRPAFSSDGSTLAIQMSTMDGASDDIYLMNADGSELRPLLKDAANYSSPVWSRNENYLFVSSDRGGVLNIFAYAFEEERLYQVTNVVTGVTQPSLSPAGDAMVLERFSHQGTDVYLVELAPDSWIPISEPLIEVSVPTESLPEVTPSPETGYRSYTSLRRPTILPTFGTDEGGFQLGLYFGGADILRQQQYSFMFLYGFGSSRFELDARYRYNRFRTKFGLFAYDRSDKYGYFFTTPQGEEEAYWQRRQGGGAFLEYPFYRSRKAEWLGALSYEYRKLSNLSQDEFEQAIPQPDTGVLSDVGIALKWTRFNRHRYSISPELGYLMFLDYRHYDEALGGDYTIDAATGDLHVHLNSFFKHHVLALRGAGGYSAGDRLTQGMFQLGGFLFHNDPTTFRRPKFYLRGYDDRTFRGDRFVLGSVEYRLPMWYLERGGLLHWEHIGLTLFGDAGDAWEEELRRFDLKYGAGAELNFQIGYWYGRIPLTLDIGLAHGFDEIYGETQVYFRARVDIFKY